MEIRFKLLPLPNYYTAPAHPHATDAAVYTALFNLMSLYYYWFYVSFLFHLFIDFFINMISDSHLPFKALDLGISATTIYKIFL